MCNVAHRSSEVDSHLIISERMNITNKWVYIENLHPYRLFHVTDVSDGYITSDKFIEFLGLSHGEMKDVAYMRATFPSEFRRANLYKLGTVIPLQYGVINEALDYEDVAILF